jgi:hypothetical protein
MKCLKKRLNERPKSASQLEQLLAAVATDTLIQTYPPGTNRRSAGNRFSHDPHARTAPGPTVPESEERE